MLAKDEENINNSSNMSAEQVDNYLVAEPVERQSYVVGMDEVEIQPQLTVAGGSEDPIKDYLRAISKEPLLNAEQEVELSKRIEAGLYASQLLKRGDISLGTEEELQWLADDGQVAKDHMIRANLRLVVSLAKRYTGRSNMEFMDLKSEGNAGLIRAVEKFDYTKGYKFSTYATWWIRQAITRGIADQGRTIRVPVHMSEVIGKFERIQRQMLQDLGREPTLEEVAEEMELEVQKVADIIDVKNHTNPVLFNTPLAEDGGELGDMIEDTSVIGPADMAEYHGLQNEIEAVLSSLSEKEAAVIKMRYGLTTGAPMTLKDISQKLGYDGWKVSQIQKKAMNKLCHPGINEKLRAFLDD